MRAFLWALRGLWRGARAAGRWLFAEGPGIASGAEAIIEQARREHWPPELLAEVRRMDELFRASFCGECSASAEYPQGRCPKCLAKLGALLDAPRAAPAPPVDPGKAP